MMRGLLAAPVHPFEAYAEKGLARVALGCARAFVLLGRGSLMFRLGESLALSPSPGPHLTFGATLELSAQDEPCCGATPIYEAWLGASCTPCAGKFVAAYTLGDPFFGLLAGR